MKKSISELLEEGKAVVEFRTVRTQVALRDVFESRVTGEPQLSASPMVYEVSEITRTVAHGGMVMIHQIAVQSGLVNAVPFLKRLTIPPDIDACLNDIGEPQKIQFSNETIFINDCHFSTEVCEKGNFSWCPKNPPFSPSTPPGSGRCP